MRSCTAHTGLMNATVATIWLPLLILVPCLSIWVYSVVDFSRTDERDMRTFSRDVWMVVLVLGSVVGGIAWLIGGRPQPPGSPRRP